MDRRDFIRTGAGAFFVAAAGSAFGAGAPSNRVRLAIVGCHAKGRGFSVMRTALKVPGVEIACVCDVDRRAREFAADHVLKATGRRPVMEKDLRKVLEFGDLDGIISETPDHFHAYSAVMAMKAGKAVYVEKPCCFCPEEGQILMRVARETGAVLQVGSQRRASVTYRAAFDYLRETNAIGEMRFAKAWYLANRESIGKGKKAAVPEWLDWDLWQGPAPREDFRDNIVHYNWHWFRKWGTSEMGNNAPHFADVSRWALGLDEFPESVQCAGGLQFPKGGDFEWPDIFNASFKYANGKMITFEMGCHNNVKPFMDVGTGALVYGERGALFLGPSDNAIVFDEKGAAIREWKAGGVVVGGDTPVSTTDPTSRLDVMHMTKFMDVGTGALVYGERGALFLGPSDNAIVFDEKGAAIREWKAGGVVVGGDTPVSTTDPTAGLDVRHMTKFVDCIRAHDAKTNADAEQGVKSSVLPLLANIALDCGETIHLDPKTGLLRSKAGEIGWAREYEKGWELA